MPTAAHAAALPADVTVFERGWLSSNNVLLHGDASQGAVLVDTGHALHAAQTVALVARALAGAPLAQIVNTHLHSDHCGGNAAVQRAFGAPVAIPPGLWDAVQRWDEDALSYRPSGQHCERFTAHRRIAPGQTLRAGARDWQVLGAPGHDPHSVVLFDPAEGVLISADALWENGFGVVFPELEGEAAFDEVGATLDLIATLPVRCVIPGHGAPFTDVAGALQRSRSRLQAFRADPARHLRHGIKVLVKYQLLAQQRQALPAFQAWFDAVPLARSAWQQLGRPAGSLIGWGQVLIDELCAAGALALVDGEVHNR
jgi:glyoxylase-like metal-dependent hydrolase (beta-lactamase superfamily II)